jgi:hypothetical protein
VTAQEIQDAIHDSMGTLPGYDPAVVQRFATHLAGTVSAAGLKSNSHPTPKQQACYDKCAATRNAALAKCALQGFPGGLICAGQAVLAFNACRADCDKG